MDLMLPQDSDSSPVFIEEMDLYFRPLREDILAMVAEELFPVLSDCLELTFEPLESWSNQPLATAAEPMLSHPSWGSRLRAWMGLS